MKGRFIERSVRRSRCGDKGEKGFMFGGIFFGDVAVGDTEMSYA